MIHLRNTAALSVTLYAISNASAIARLFTLRLLLLFSAALILYAVLPHSVSAAIALQQSRVVFIGDRLSASLTVNNQNPHDPYLAQGWIEDESGHKVQGPLLLLPPIQRIEPGEKSQIKIQALPAARLLRQDRETLFYLNLREIPKRSAKENTLQIALQNRIKIFYRPVALKVSPELLATPWQSQLILDRQGDGWKITNPSAYYITLINAQPTIKSLPVTAFQPLMLAPGESQQLPGNAADYGMAPVFTYINDYGGQPQLAFRCQAQQCKVESNTVSH